MAAALITAGVLSGCAGGAGHVAAAGPADRTFLQQMIPHHQRAIAVARLGEARASSPAVRAFARRIVQEQTPELDRMMAAVSRGRLSVDLRSGAATAVNRITDSELATLRSLHGRAFDHRFLSLNVSSEQGAAAMATTELSHGTDPATRAIARPIAGAPDSEIPQLQALLARTPV